MIIKTLILKSFGKFQNTTIELKEGINVISGENESGKSTIHQFIEGMFYGFYKQNIKNKKTTEAYDKYFPWENGKDYSGVMIINDKDDIRIERNFMRNQDTVQIFNNTTGENITKDYPYDAVSKMHQPALNHLKINLSSYQNTISITQMQSKTSEELVMEIKNNIINIGETKSIDVSINNIMKKISDKKAEIGTERSKRSNYGRLKEEITAIENERNIVASTYEEIKKLKIQENDLIEELGEKEKEKNKIELKMLHLKKQEEEEAVKRYMQLKAEADEIDMQLKKLDIFQETSKEEINNILIKTNNINIYKDLIEDEYLKVNILKDSKKDLEEKIAEIEGLRIQTGISENVSRDIYKFEELESSKKFSSTSLEIEKTDELREKIVRSKKDIVSTRVLLFITMLVTLIPGSIKLFEFFGETLVSETNNPKLLASFNLAKENSLITLAGLLLMLLVTLLVWLQGKSKQNELIYLEEQINLAFDIEESIKNRIKEINEQQGLILNQYNIKSLDELYMLRDKKFKEELAYQEAIRKMQSYKEDIEAHNKNLEDLNKKINEKKNIIENDSKLIFSFMEKLDVKTENELKDLLDKYDTYKRLEQDKVNREYLMVEMTKAKPYLKSINLIIHEDKPLNFNNGSINKTYEDLENELKELNNKILEMNQRVSVISTEILNKENQVREPAIVEEDLNKKYNELEKLTFKLNTYNIIEEAILSISKDIQNSFAPKLNESMSKLIGIATDYKYTDIKVNQDLEISIVDNETNKLVDVGSLSAGTIDLIYFALRLSISEIINNTPNMPIILDDSFVQYDERRLIKIMEVLSKLKRQVILFTCHKRELTIIKKIADNPHIINI